MSSLRNSYRKLTNETNQGIFTKSVELLNKGKAVIRGVPGQGNIGALTQISGEEVVLIPKNSTYMFKITNRSGVTVDVDTFLGFAELEGPIT